VGDFNDWDGGASPLREGGDGVWSVVLPLSRGAFAYSFLVDGDEWRADPMAPAAPDDFGRPSSVVYVSPESAP
jgi:1,4-alpha-glucan branching enzyme